METEKRKYKKHKKGYAISVKYYLRQSKGVLGMIKDIIQNNVDERGLPLYMKVAFLGQNVKMRSRLNLAMNEEEFDERMKSPQMVRRMQDEIAAIKCSIRKLNPDKIEDFLISQWSSYYNVGNEKLSDCIEQVVGYKLRRSLETTFDLSELNPDAVISVTVKMAHVKVLAKLGVLQAAEIYEKFEPLLDILCQIESSQIDTTYWDWESGALHNVVKKRYRNESQKWLSLINEGIIEYREIRQSENL